MSEVTVSTPEPEAGGSEATALAAGAAAANAAHAQATADEALETAEAAASTASAALQMPPQGLTADEVRGIVRDHLASAETVIETPTEPSEPEVISVPPEAPSEPPSESQEANLRRGHPLMRMFLGRRG